MPKPSDKNVSGLSNAGINALLHVNRAFPVVLADGKWNHARRNIAAFITAQMSGHCALLPLRERQAIDAFYQDSNEALRKTWFPQRERLFQANDIAHGRWQFIPLKNNDFSKFLTCPSSLALGIGLVKGFAVRLVLIDTHLVAN